MRRRRGGWCCTLRWRDIPVLAVFGGRCNCVAIGGDISGGDISGGGSGARVVVCRRCDRHFAFTGRSSGLSDGLSGSGLGDSCEWRASSAFSQCCFAGSGVVGGLRFLCVASLLAQ